jgi:hypothetical protein
MALRDPHNPSVGTNTANLAEAKLPGQPPSGTADRPRPTLADGWSPHDPELRRAIEDTIALAADDQIFQAQAAAAVAERRAPGTPALAPTPGPADAKHRTHLLREAGLQSPTSAVPLETPANSEPPATRHVFFDPPPAEAGAPAAGATPVSPATPVAAPVPIPAAEPDSSASGPTESAALPSLNREDAAIARSSRIRRRVAHASATLLKDVAALSREVTRTARTAVAEVRRRHVPMLAQASTQLHVVIPALMLAGIVVVTLAAFILARGYTTPGDAKTASQQQTGAVAAVPTTGSSNGVGGEGASPRAGIASATEDRTAAVAVNADSRPPSGAPAGRFLSTLAAPSTVEAVQLTTSAATPRPAPAPVADSTPLPTRPQAVEGDQRPVAAAGQVAHAAPRSAAIASPERPAAARPVQTQNPSVIFRPADARTAASTRRSASASAAATTRRANVFIGTLEVLSDPPGASVAVNNQHVGTTPLVLREVPAGTHAVRVDSPGFQRWSRAILVATGKHAKVEATLRATRQ